MKFFVEKYSKYNYVVGRTSQKYLEKLGKLGDKPDAEKAHYPKWFKYQITVAIKFRTMMTSCFGNLLDKTVVGQILSKGKWVNQAKYHKDMNELLIAMQSGIDNLNMPVSPVCHTLVHMFDMLKLDNQFGLGKLYYTILHYITLYYTILY